MNNLIKNQVLSDDTVRELLKDCTLEEVQHINDSEKEFQETGITFTPEEVMEEILRDVFHKEENYA